MASAVFCALLGYQTWPDCKMVRSEVSGAPGSAGMLREVEAVSTAITPTAMPPRRARPVTTERAQPAWTSCQEPLHRLGMHCISVVDCKDAVFFGREDTVTC